MAMTFFPSGPLEEVDNSARSTASGSGASLAAPQTIELSDGRHVLVWSIADDPSEPSRVYAQFLDAEGQLEGSRLAIAEGAYLSGVTATSNGGFIASWQGGLTQAFSAAGQPTTDVRDLTMGLAVSLTTLADGRVVAAFAEDLVLKVQFLTDTLQPLGLPLDVATGVSGVVDLASLNDGGFAVAFKANWQIASIKFDAEGTAGLRVQHGVPDGSGEGEDDYRSLRSNNPTIAANGDDGYVVAWTETLFEYDGKGSLNFDEQVKAQRVDADGGAVGAAFVVNTSDTGGFVAPTI
ncbi:MAG TPA: hypothetical protein VGW34_09675, partial [Allosphingosinicella sp.]|nr:hypothetical protein [Allosphingosinicella sp.]